MFHKEGSCTDIISSNNNNGGGGKAKGKGKGKGKQQPPSFKGQPQETLITKAVDVPLRKSDRRKLRQRAAAYFFGNASSAVEETAENDGDSNEIKHPIESLLDEIFLKGGTISSRILPRYKGNHESMVLYVKSPSSSESDNDTSSWPYQKKAQFVWIALEDKKSGSILHETPSVALLAVVSHHSVFPDPENCPATITSFWEDFGKNRIVTVHSPVSRYLCRGADLMRAGIISAPEQKIETSTQLGGNQKNKNQKKKGKSASFTDGAKDMVVICARGNPQPFAVGRSILWSSNTNSNSTEESKAYGYGTKGIGVEIWNCLGDDLWRTTTPAGAGATTKDGEVNIENRSYGNPGFCTIEKTGELCVLPLVGYGDESDDEDEGDQDEDKQVENLDNSESNKDNEAPTDVDSNVENEKGESATSGDEAKVPLTSNGTDPVNMEDSNAMTQEEEAEIETESPPSPDEILHAAVCQALVNLKKNDLPILVGTFYTKHVLSNLPNGIESGDLLKQTSYRKFGNYLKEWQIINNDDSGLVKTGPDPSNRMNKDPNACLILFNRRHEDLYGMKKTKPSGGSSDVADGNSKIALVKLHVVPNHWTSLLRLDPEDVSATNATSEARRGSGMLTLPEVRKILEKYLERDSSLMISKSVVALDGPLTDALFGKKSKEELPEKLSRKELSKRFVEKMSPAFCLVRMPGSHVLKLGRGLPPKVQIEVVKRQSKKFVTRLRGLEEYLGFANTLDPSEFCKVVSKRLAISGSVDSDPAASGRAAFPKKGCVEYVFGANVVDELEALLTGDESLSDHGGTKGSWAYPRIPTSVIEVTLRKGVPARKKRRGGGGGKR